MIEESEQYQIIETKTVDFNLKKVEVTYQTTPNIVIRSSLGSVNKIIKDVHP